ncbi:hypothetical protein LWI28_028751 [Acer negundo]|uniref:Uncharacterized protein n=1 Tax=Acer negundo TaxID=4023 RepID=A0AAD5INE2_ACENE|nr:hypothetical protein LWI28_028751 [Acer negundo]
MTKKCTDHQENVYKNRGDLKVANIVDKPASWKEIVVLEERLNYALNIDERYWKQRARIDWLKSGDKNSRFFHSKASARKARNRIRGLHDKNGHWKDSKTDIERIVANYFENLFTTSGPNQEATEKVLQGLCEDF